MTVGTDSPAEARSDGPHAPERAELADATAPGDATAPADFAGIRPDDLPDGLVVADETGRVVCFNAAAARITAVPADRALGLPSIVRCPWRTSRAAAGGR